MEKKRDNLSQRIIAVKRDNQGRPVEFKTDNGKVFNYEMAKEAIDLKIIKNAVCYLSHEGTRKIMLKDNNDQQFSLDSLPEF